MKLAIIGATGMVGREMLKILEERDFPFKKLILVASEKSRGNTIFCKGARHQVISLEDLENDIPDLALFSAGREIAKNWAPKLAEKGCKVIDNSSYWRMYSNHKLIIPTELGTLIRRRT